MLVMYVTITFSFSILYQICHCLYFYLNDTTRYYLTITAYFFIDTNPNIYKFIILGSKQQVAKAFSYSPAVRLNDKVTDSTPLVRNLGVQVDSHLIFEKHIQEISK